MHKNKTLKLIIHDNKNNNSNNKKTLKNQKIFNFNTKIFWNFDKKKYYNKNKYYLNHQHVENPQLIERFKKLYIPPAYTNVIVAKSPNYKVQAIGIDTKGRKQYIYHPKFIQKQINKKYNKIIELGSKILKIENDNKKEISNIVNSTSNNLKFPDDYYPIILLLLLKYHFRIGNQKYEEDNNSFGITTLKKKHIIFLNNNDEFCIEFIGKKGVLNKITDKNATIYNTLKKIINQNNNDSHIFCNYNENNVKKIIHPDDVSNYLKNKYNANITPKMFRTWYANYHLLSYLKDISKNNPIIISKKMSKKQINSLVKESSQYVSNKLNNTPSVSKKAYIDPDLLKMFLKNPSKFIQSIPDKKKDIHKHLQSIYK